MRVSKTTWVWLGAGVVGIIFIASAVMLFISAKLEQQTITKGPQYDAQTLYERGSDQMQKGDYPAAEQSLEQALRSSNDATYRGELAVVKYRLKKYQESIALYQQLISEGRDAAFCWNGIGNASRDWAEADTSAAKEHLSTAIDAYQKAIALNAQYVAAYANLALVYSSEGDTASAAHILDVGIAATGSKDLSDTKVRILSK